jgi:alkylation response protein AidB-like acyl-CoA dehydrogenase
MDYVAYAIAVEELGRVDPSAADTLSSHVTLVPGRSINTEPKNRNRNI